MTEITIPFNQWSSTRLMTGLKHSTWRSKIYGAKGDTFTHLGRHYKLIHEPFQVPLGILLAYLYRLEGATTPQEIESVLRSIKRSPTLDMKELGWLHLFAEVV